MFPTNNSSKPRAWYAKQPTSTDHLSQIQREMSKFQQHTPDQQKAKLTELLTRAVIDKQKNSVSQKSFKDSVQSITEAVQKHPPSDFKKMALEILSELQKEQKTTNTAPQSQASPSIQRGFMNTVFNRLEPKSILEKPIQTLADVFQDKTTSQEALADAVKDYLQPENHDGIPPRIRVQLFNEFINSQMAKTSEEYPLIELKLTFANMALTYLESIGSKSLPTPGMFGLVHGETARQKKPENEGRKAFVQTSLGELSTLPKSTLGSGAFGITKKATAEGTDYVIKKIPLSRSGWAKNYLDFFSATKEAAIGKHLSGHPNIAQTVDMYVYDDAKVSAPEQKTTTESKFVIVMEPGLKNGEEVLKDPSLSAKKKIQFLLDAAQGLEHIHDAGFVHNDVKADNFLLFEGDIGKVSDFGRSGRIGDIDANDNQLKITEDTENFLKLLRNELPTILKSHYGPTTYYAVYRPIDTLRGDNAPSTMGPMITLLKNMLQQLENIPVPK